MIQDISEIGVWSHKHIDHRDKERGFSKLQAIQILNILLCGYKCVCPWLLPCLLDCREVPPSVAMVIGKDGLATNGEPPISEIAEEGVWIANTAEGKKRAGTNFFGTEKSDLAAETAKSEQASGCSKNGIMMELADRVECS